MGNFITKGTLTSTGGQVLEGHQDVMVGGQPATSIGQKASCASGRQSCKGIGEIVSVSSNQVVMPNGKQAALPNDKVMCNCPDNIILNPTNGINIGPTASSGTEVSFGLGSERYDSTELDKNVAPIVKTSDKLVNSHSLVDENLGADSVHMQTMEFDSALKQRLEAYLETIDSAIEEGRQIPESTSASCDKKIMAPLLNLANLKKVGLNASFCEGPNEMVEKIKSLIQGNIPSARFIVNMGGGGNHFAAFDYMFKDGKASVVGIEPATTNGMGPALLILRTMMAFQRELPAVALVVIESDLQRSRGECGIFSLALVKKMLKERSVLQELHLKNVQGFLPAKNGLVAVNDANKLLPAAFLKHAQSPNRLKAYLVGNPELSTEPVNKKGESLQDRQERHLVEIIQEDKSIKYSRSIELKRKSEVENLLQFLNDK